MRRKSLKKSQDLLLTAAMASAAETDIPEESIRKKWQHTGGRYAFRRCTVYHYKFRLFIRASVVEGNILKVSLWTRESVVAGRQLGDYLIYLDKRKMDFITYVTAKEKWSNAKVDSLEWPESYYDGKTVWMDPKTRQLVMEYTDNGRSGLDAIHHFQIDVRKDQISRREKKETDPWDRMQDLVPDIPRYFEQWVRKYPQKMNYIVYEYDPKGATQGWCSFCGQTVEIRNPKHLKKGVCRRCRREIVFLAKGKSKTVHEKDYAELLQKTDTGIVVRGFEVHTTYTKGNLCVPVISLLETRRAFYTTEGICMGTYFWELYKNKEMRWVSKDHVTYTFWHQGRALFRRTTVYPKNLTFLKTTGLQYSGLKEMVLHSDIDPTRYIDAYRTHREIEKLTKAGLYRTVEDILLSFEGSEFIQTGKNPQEILGMTKEEIRLLKEAGENLAKLKMIKYMRDVKGATKLTAEQLNRLVQYDSGKQLKELYTHTTIHKALRYIESQEDFKPGTYADYLDMCIQLQYDLSNSFILFPKDWKRAHDEVSEEHNRRRAEIEARKKSEQSKKIEQRYKETRKVFSFRYKGIFIVVPHNAQEIIQEGHNNHHCVATYIDRVAEEQTTILFVRKEEGESFYTMEVNNDYRIIQCRTKYNKSYTEHKEVERFVKEFDKKILEPLRLKKTAEKVLLAPTT